MTPEQAKTLADFFVPAFEAESQTTRRVIAAMPAEKGDYAPDPKSMKALDLAFHLAASDVWFLESIAAGAFAPGGGARPGTIKTPADILAWYQPAFDAAIARVKALSPEDLAKEVVFHTSKNPNVAYLLFSMNHMVHHRGQLSAYLRPMGGKVPGIYGGSADEPLTTPVEASTAAG